MLQKYILIGFFISMSINAFPNFGIEEFFILDREISIKMITENSFSKWKTVSFFDREGFLVRKVNYYKNEIRADYRYEYFISDTLLEIKSKEYRNINNEPKSYIIYKYYYNYLKQCYRVESYSSKDIEKPLGFLGYFIYKNNQLQSYERHSSIRNIAEFDKYVYVYDDNQRTKLFYTYEDSVPIYRRKSIAIFENGKQTDFIRECDGGGIISGEVCWDNKMNKVHIRYSDMDKRGNWTRSYFITEKRKVFRSKRKIEYW